jgi:hypothetical protein
MEVASTETNKNTENLVEYALDIDEFNHPKVYKGSDAVVSKLIELALLKPGTYPTRPNMGLGLIERYRYTSDLDLEKLKTEYQEQIQTYLPDLASAEVDIIEKERVIKFYIAINQITYTLILDTATKTLSSL